MMTALNAANTLRKLPWARLSRKMKGMSAGGVAATVVLVALDAFFPVVGEMFAHDLMQTAIEAIFILLGGFLGGYAVTEDVRRFLTDDELRAIVRD